jgi:hypothetical protein
MACTDGVTMHVKGQMTTAEAGNSVCTCSSESIWPPPALSQEPPICGAEPPVPPGVVAPDGCVEPLSADGRASMEPGLQQ